VHAGRARDDRDPKSVKDRIAQVAWIPHHLDDLASDLSAIHGIRDMSRLSGAALCKLAYRMTAYQSVMQARYAEQHRGEAPERPPARTAPPQRGSRQREMVPATKAALQANPVMAGLISFGSGKKKA